VAASAFLACAAIAAAGAGVVSSADDGDENTATASRSCDRLASPGSRAVQRLVNSLRPGQVGCLSGGTYRGPVMVHNRGRRGQPITLQSRPGESARVVGRVVVSGRSSHLIVRRLWLDGRNRDGLPSPTVNGRRIRFVDNDVTNRHTAICFALGHERFGVAQHVTIQSNRIHDCGRLPATNLDQGVYVAEARDTRIVGNWIYGNADQGIQLYPDARRSYIAGNVIDSNGEGIIFGGSGRQAAVDNLVEGNVISNSTIRENVESHFDGPIGTGNVVRRNCIGGGVRDAGMGGILEPQVGFEATDNVLAVPSFRGLTDYRLRPGSPCTKVFSGAPGRVPGPRLRPPVP
jgi:Right handed beta helix region